MLEIILLFSLCRKMGKSMREKKRNPLGYQIAIVVLWFGGEVAGALTYVVVQAAGGNPVQEFDLGLYVGALLGGAIGVASVFFMASTVDAAYDDVGDVASPDASFDNFDGRKPDPNNPYSSPNR